MSAQPLQAPGSTGQWGYWAALLGAALVATLVPWYLGVIEIDVRPALRVLLTGGALALALMQLDLAKRGQIGAALPHLVGVAVLAGAWYLLGTFDVTGFLLLFAVPTYAAALDCGRWTVLGVATLTVLGAAAAALAVNPELRWQLEQIDVLADLVPRTFGGGLDELRFASSAAGREQLATLAVFAVTILAVAGVGSSAAGVIYGQARTLQRADRAHRESESLVSKLLDDSRTMDAIVSKAGRVHSMSRAFRETLGDAADLVDILRPVYAEPLTQLLATADGGTIAAQRCNPRDRRWLLDIEAHPLVVGGEAMQRVQIRRTPANDLAPAALDALGIAVLLLGPDKTIAFASAAVQRHFPRATPGAAAAEALDERYALPAHWWDIAPSTSAQVRFINDGNGYLARIALTGTQADSALTSIELAAEGAP